jgi:hypothetical protein
MEDPGDPHDVCEPIVGSYPSSVSAEWCTGHARIRPPHHTSSQASNVVQTHSRGAVQCGTALERDPVLRRLQQTAIDGTTRSGRVEAFRRCGLVRSWDLRRGCNIIHLEVEPFPRSARMTQGSAAPASLSTSHYSARLPAISEGQFPSTVKGVPCASRTGKLSKNRSPFCATS